MVEAFMALLKVAATVWLRGTPVAPFAGIVEITVGLVVSGASPVVKVHTKLLVKAVPARSLAPVVSVAVYNVLARSGTGAVNVATDPSAN